jgi:phage shock protein C
MTRTPDDTQRGFYRSRRGIIFGVCRGLADYFDLSVFWIRILVLALFVFTGFWPAVVAYIVAGLIMKKEPVVGFASEADREFYDSYARSRALAVHRIKRAYDRLDRRIRRMEDRVTAPDFDWDRRLHQS